MHRERSGQVHRVNRGQIVCDADGLSFERIRRAIQASMVKLLVGVVISGCRCSLRGRSEDRTRTPLRAGRFQDGFRRQPSDGPTWGFPVTLAGFEPAISTVRGWRALQLLRKARCAQTVLRPSPVRPALEGLHSVPRLRRRHPPARSDRLAQRPARTSADASERALSSFRFQLGTGPSSAGTVLSPVHGHGHDSRVRVDIPRPGRGDPEPSVGIEPTT